MPHFCTNCSRIGSYLCSHCYEEIEFQLLPVKIKLEPNYLDKLIASTYYQEPIKSLLHELKYKSVKNIGKWCARFLYEITPFPSATFITAVPLHYRRQAQRGFNQAEEIARELTRLTKTPYLPLLQRTKNTKYQAAISDRDQRLTQLKECFSLNPKAAKQFAELKKQVPNLSVLLIDDVSTTGTTLNECAKVLKENGCATIYGLVVAHGS